MNILDENIPDNQRILLRSWHISFRQVGYEVGRKGMKDAEIITMLHQLQKTTFFTRDIGFFHSTLCHKNYCIVCLALDKYEVASFIRRFLKHPEFHRNVDRRGKVIRLSHSTIRLYELNKQGIAEIDWLSKSRVRHS